MSGALDDILEQIDVAEWLDAQGLSYRNGASGQLQLQCCPFCGSSSWKVYMRADDGRGTCFAGNCQQGFNLYSFARQHLNADNRTTARHLSDFARERGFSVLRAPKPAPAVVHTEGWRMPSSIALPAPGGKTHPFLTSRRITPTTTEKFGLRWSPSGRYDYTSLEGRNAAMDFSQRVLIPVADLDGTVQTFQGRDVTGEAEKRYLFPPMLPGSGRFLYGGHLVRGKPHLVIGEGAFDVMAIDQAISGHPDFRDTGTIGSFGLSIGSGNETGDDQLGRLRALAREGLARVTMLWDGEVGALRAALEAGRLLKRQNLVVAIGLLPQDRDPNEVDTAVVRRAIEEAVVLSDEEYFRLKFMPPYRDRKLSIAC